MHRRKKRKRKKEKEFLVVRKWPDCSARKQKEDGDTQKKQRAQRLHRLLPETRNRVLKRVRLVSSANMECFSFTCIICFSLEERCLPRKDYNN